jgi:hypothetical protein
MQQLQEAEAVTEIWQKKLKYPNIRHINLSEPRYLHPVCGI